MINHNKLKPALAPVIVVAINSPEPTIDAAMISPGPKCDRIPSQ
jgi:hypothetical protein